MNIFIVGLLPLCAIVGTGLGLFICYQFALCGFIQYYAIIGKLTASEEQPKRKSLWMHIKAFFARFKRKRK